MLDTTPIDTELFGECGVAIQARIPSTNLDVVNLVSDVLDLFPELRVAAVDPSREGMCALLITRTARKDP